MGMNFSGQPSGVRRGPTTQAPIKFITGHVFKTLKGYLNPTSRITIVGQGSTNQTVTASGNSSCDAPDGMERHIIISYDTVQMYDSYGISIDGSPSEGDDAIDNSTDGSGNPVIMGTIGDNPNRPLPFTSNVYTGDGLSTSDYGTYDYTDPSTGAVIAAPGATDPKVKKPKIGVNIGTGLKFDTDPGPLNTITPTATPPGTTDPNNSNATTPKYITIDLAVVNGDTASGLVLDAGDDKNGVAVDLKENGGLVLDANQVGVLVDNATIIIRADGRLQAAGESTSGVEAEEGLVLLSPDSAAGFTPTLTLESGSGVELGDHDYVFAFANADDSLEGACSASASITVTVGHGKVLIQVNTPNPDGANPDTRIYRTQAGGSAYGFLTTLAPSVYTYEDTTPDADLDMTDTPVFGEPSVVGLYLRAQTSPPIEGPAGDGPLQGYGGSVYNTSGLAFDDDTGAVYVNVNTNQLYLNYAGQISVGQAIVSTGSGAHGIGVDTEETGLFNHDTTYTLSVRTDGTTTEINSDGKIVAIQPESAIDQIDWSCGTVAGGLPDGYNVLPGDVGASGADYNLVFGSPGNPFRFAGVTPVVASGQTRQYNVQAQYTGQPAEWGPFLLTPGNEATFTAGDDHTIPRVVISAAPFPVASRYRLLVREGTSGDWNVLRELPLQGVGNFGFPTASQKWYWIPTATDDRLLWGNPTDPTDTAGQFGDDTMSTYAIGFLTDQGDTLGPPVGWEALGAGAGSPWGIYDCVPSGAFLETGITDPGVPPSNRVGANYDDSLTCKEGQLSLNPDQPNAVTFPEISAGVHNTGTPGQAIGTTITPNGVYTPHLEITGAASIINAGTLRQRAITAPTAAPGGSGYLYAKSALGRTVPYWQDEAGRESPLLGALEWSILTDGHGNLIFMDGDVIAVSTFV